MSTETTTWDPFKLYRDRRGAELTPAEPATETETTETTETEEPR